MAEPIYLYDELGEEHRITLGEPYVKLLLARGWTREPVLDYSKMSEVNLRELAKKKGVKYAQQKNVDTIIAELEALKE